MFDRLARTSAHSRQRPRGSLLPVPSRFLATGHVSGLIFSRATVAREEASAGAQLPSTGPCQRGCMSPSAGGFREVQCAHLSILIWLLMMTLGGSLVLDDFSGYKRVHLYNCLKISIVVA